MAPATRSAVRVEVSAERADWDRTAWDGFVAGCDHARLYHRAVFRDLIEEVFGHRTYYLTARTEDGGITGVLPLARLSSRLFGDFLVSLPYFNYGGAAATDANVRGVLEHAAEGLASGLAVSHVEFRDRCARDDGTPVRTDKVTRVRALPDTEDRLWQEVGSKVRAQVKKPLRSGAEAVVGGAELVDEFYGVFARNMRDLGTPVYTRVLFDTVCRYMGSDASVVVVRLAGRTVAAAVLLRHGASMEIPWASSLGEHNRLGVNMLLYWEVLAHAIRNGCRTFDFGRSTAGSGTDRFKRQWGGESVQLYWHYWLRSGAELPRLNPDNPRYRIATSVWKKLPLAVANRIGPSLVRNLP